MNIMNKSENKCPPWGTPDEAAAILNKVAIQGKSQSTMKG